MEKKKSGKELSPEHKESKMDSLKAMHEMAGDAIKSKLAGLKKVSVASPSSEGLKEGLDKAKELVKGMSEDHSSSMDSEESPLHEGSESAEEEREEHMMPEGMHPEAEEEELTVEEIDQKIEELMAKKQALASQK